MSRNAIDNIQKKKPPDKIKTIKNRLNNILRRDINHSILFNDKENNVELLLSYFYQINEHKLKNLKVSVNNKTRKIHSVLTYQMGNNRLGCINRDNNAVTNMIQIVESLIKTQKRPSVFDRRTKIVKATEIKVSDPKSSHNSECLASSRNHARKSACTTTKRLTQKQILARYKKVCEQSYKLTKKNITR